jgi:hypothetical protein
VRGAIKVGVGARAGMSDYPHTPLTQEEFSDTIGHIVDAYHRMNGFPRDPVYVRWFVNLKRLNRRSDYEIANELVNQMTHIHNRAEVKSAADKMVFTFDESPLLTDLKMNFKNFLMMKADLGIRSQRPVQTMLPLLTSLHDRLERLERLMN